MASLMVVRELHHDVNFHFPVREVENDSNTRTVREPSLHAKFFFQGSLHFIEEFIEGFINSDPGSALYPIIDKTRSPSRSRSPLEANFAEALGYLITDTAHLKTEIGYITILPPFQSHTWLLMEYALNPPSLSGLGLRRVRWRTNEVNHQSVHAAERIGFKMEGIFRRNRVLHSGKGKPGSSILSRAGDPRSNCVGRHTSVLAMCWDD
ncbi:hypothetical protein EV401DRAFT_2086647 [Pisolithus croceorrhizus]|nr:hypothetical protein EV401DRAFT_2086647 [Pisolithus croceorrhizus]